MQIEEKMHVPVAIPFPDDLMTLMKTYIICIVFTNGMFPGYTFFMTDTKNKEHVSWVLRKYIACAINGAGNWFVCVPACASGLVGVSLTSLHLKAKFNKKINFMIAAIIH